MPLTGLLLLGAVVGALSTLGVYFDRNLAGKPRIVAAGAIRGTLVALLVVSTKPLHGGLLAPVGLGALYAGIIAVMVILSQGSAARRHAIHILPPAVLSGALIGLLVGILARPA